MKGKFCVKHGKVQQIKLCLEEACQLQQMQSQYCICQICHEQSGHRMFYIDEIMGRLGRSFYQEDKSSMRQRLGMLKSNIISQYQRFIDEINLILQEIVQYIARQRDQFIAQIEEWQELNQPRQDESIKLCKFYLRNLAELRKSTVVNENQEIFTQKQVLEQFKERMRQEVMKIQAKINQIKNKNYQESEYRFQKIQAIQDNYVDVQTGVKLATNTFLDARFFHESNQYFYVQNQNNTTTYSIMQQPGTKKHKLKVMKQLARTYLWLRPYTSEINRNIFTRYYIGIDDYWNAHLLQIPDLKILKQFQLLKEDFFQIYYDKGYIIRSSTSRISLKKLSIFNNYKTMASSDLPETMVFMDTEIEYICKKLIEFGGNLYLTLSSGLHIYLINLQKSLSFREQLVRSQNKKYFEQDLTMVKIQEGLDQQNFIKIIELEVQVFEDFEFETFLIPKTDLLVIGTTHKVILYNLQTKSLEKQLIDSYSTHCILRLTPISDYQLFVIYTFESCTPYDTPKILNTNGIQNTGDLSTDVCFIDFQKMAEEVKIISHIETFENKNLSIIDITADLQKMIAWSYQREGQILLSIFSLRL